EATDAELRSRPVEAILPADRSQPADAVVLRWPDGRTTSFAELDAFARDTNAAWHDGSSPADVATLVDQLASSFARAEEARQRGLDQDQAHLDRLRWELRSLRAELVLRPAIEAGLEPPSSERIAALFERHRSRLETAEETEVEALILSIRPDEIAKSVYDRFAELPARLRDGLDWSSATAELAPWVLRERWGRENTKQTFRRGRDVEAGINALEPGDISDVLQEKRTLFIVRLLARYPSRPLTLAEATPRLHASLREADRRQLRNRLRAELLTELDVHILSPAPSSPEKEP
ncbi:MAG: peptidylprolyl isomerase, partial [Acidobacteriota bacterium]